MQLTVRFDPKPRGVEFSIPFTRAFALRFFARPILAGQPA